LQFGRVFATDSDLQRANAFTEFVGMLGVARLDHDAQGTRHLFARPNTLSERSTEDDRDRCRVVGVAGLPKARRISGLGDEEHGRRYGARPIKVSGRL
jgi:hypothetical protein